jgi:hypothetical protein
MASCIEGLGLYERVIRVSRSSPNVLANLTYNFFRMFLLYKGNLAGGLNLEILDLAREGLKQLHYVVKQAQNYTWPQRCSIMSLG